MVYAIGAQTTISSQPSVTFSNEANGEQAGSGGTGTCGVALCVAPNGFASASAPTLGLGASAAWATVQVALVQASSAAEVTNFIGRSFLSANVASTSLAVPVPAGTAVGDLMLVWVTASNSMCAAPAGWTQIGSTVTDTGGGIDKMALFWKLYATADGSTITFGASNISFPKAIMRVYRYAVRPDQNAGVATSSLVSTIQIPALSATLLANEVYAAEWSLNQTITALRVSGLGGVGFDAVQWATWEGDKLISTAGTVPAAETLTVQGGTTQGVAYAVTLVPSSPTTGSSAGHATIVGHMSAMRGVSAGQATVTGQFAATGRFKGASAGQATVTGHFAAIGRFTGASAGQGIVAGRFAAIGRFKGSAAGQGNVAGFITGDFPATGVANGHATVVGHMAAMRGISTGSATVLGHFAAIGRFTGASNGQATVTGQFAAIGRFAGASNGQATVVGHMSAMRGIIAGTAAVVGHFAAIGRFTGVSAGQATVTGQFAAIGRFTGASAGRATVTGHLVAMVGVSTGSATVTGHLAAIGRFRGASAGIALASGKIQGFINITGSSAGSAVVSGRLVAIGRMVFAAAGTATVSGRLAARRAMTAQANGLGNGNGQLAAIGRFTGTSHGTVLATAVGASLNRAIFNASGSASVVGRFRALAQFTGTTTAAATVTGHIIGAAFRHVASAGAAVVVGYFAAIGRIRAAGTGSATVLGQGASRSAQRGSSAGLAIVNGNILQRATGIGRTTGQGIPGFLSLPPSGIFIAQGDPDGQAIVQGFGAFSTVFGFVDAALAAKQSQQFTPAGLTPKNSIIHTTTDGERWDTLAWRYYGNASFIGPIVQANPQIAIEAVFETGLTIAVPILTVNTAAPAKSGWPPWKQTLFKQAA